MEKNNSVRECWANVRGVGALGWSERCLFFAGGAGISSKWTLKQI